MSEAGAIVVKVGGSLMESGRLGLLLSVIARATVPVVVVPGGGPFADAVREIQPRFDLPDSLAHELAILAMDQMALVIASSSPLFARAARADEIAERLANGQIPVWMPYAMAHADGALPADWTVTSDTLAAWLAAAIGAREVVLVKSCPVPSDAAPDRLAAAGIIDAHLPKFLMSHALSCRVLGAGDESLLAARLTAHRRWGE